MNLALNNLQRLICPKSQTNKLIEANLHNVLVRHLDEELTQKGINCLSQKPSTRRSLPAPNMAHKEGHTSHIPVAPFENQLTAIVRCDSYTESFGASNTETLLSQEDQSVRTLMGTIDQKFKNSPIHFMIRTHYLQSDLSARRRRRTRTRQVNPAEYVFRLGTIQNNELTRRFYRTCQWSEFISFKIKCGEVVLWFLVISLQQKQHTIRTLIKLP